MREQVKVGVRRRAALMTGTCIAVATLLAACGSGSGNAAGSTTPKSANEGTPSRTAVGSAQRCPLDARRQPGAPVDVTFWYAQAGAAGDEMSRLVAKFNATHPDIKVKGVFEPDVMTAYFASLRDSSHPDIAAVDGSALGAVVDSNSTVDAGDCIAAEHASTSDFLPTALGGVRVNGRIVALPFDGSGIVLYYDRNDFRRAGLDPDKPPTTLRELHEDSLAIMKSGAAHHGVAWSVADGYIDEAMYKANAEVVNHGNGRQSRATASTIDSATARHLAHELRQMADDGSLMASGGYDDTSTFLETANGDTAMTIGPALAIGNVMIAIANGVGKDIDLAVGRAPAIDSGDTGGFAYIGSPLAISKNKDSKKVVASYKFARWLDAPAQQAAWHAAVGSVPARFSALTLSAVTKLWTSKPYFRPAVEQVRGDTLPPGGGAFLTGAASSVDKALSDAFVRILTAHAEPDTALADAKRTADAAIKSYNDRLAGGS